jgi:HlyD family secretion protein
MRSISFGVSLLFSLLVGLILGVVVAHFGPSWQPSATPPEASAPVAPTRITALGRVEPADGIILIGSPTPDFLHRWLDGIAEGAQVKAGQALAELASRAERQVECALIRAQIDECQRKKENVQIVGKSRIHVEEVRARQLEEMSRLEIKVQQAKLAYLQRQVENARRNSKRLVAVPDSTISPQEREQQELLVAQAEAECGAGQVALEQVEKGSKLKLELAQAELSALRADLARTEAEIPLESLRQQQALAALRLEQTRLTAPCAGEILKIYARPGELVGGQQPVLQMADTSRMAVTAEVYETDIDKVQVGQPVLVWSRAWPNQKLTGTVTAKGHMIARNRIMDADPTASVDRRVLEVTIRLDDPAPAARMIHHQVYVEIAVGAPPSPGMNATGALP